jgi:hypothetical protein
MPRHRVSLPKDQAVWLKLVDELASGASDRAAVVLAGGIVEAVLDELVESWLLPGAKLDFLTGLGAKRDLAVALGLIDAKEKAQVDAIVDVRNLFAHRLQEATFDSEVVQKCLRVLRAGRRANAKDSPRTLLRKAVTEVLSLRLRVRNPITPDAFRKEMERRIISEMLAFVQEQERKAGRT